MREDMYKVIVERPRHGSRMSTRDGRIFRESENAPFKLGMKKGYANRKWLNENLSPLKRWLQSQVNRPWNQACMCTLLPASCWPTGIARRGARCGTTSA